jgi:hypothetical protein
MACPRVIAQGRGLYTRPFPARLLCLQ